MPDDAPELPFDPCMKEPFNANARLKFVTVCLGSKLFAIQQVGL